MNERSDLSVTHGTQGASGVNDASSPNGADKRNAAKRYAYLDALRLLAAFLVIVNHTNSYVFKALTPENGTWYASILWYYLSKPAVPLFVMISGACLLNRVDGYRKTARRAARLLVVLVLFSYAYYLHDAWVHYGLWPRMADFGSFFQLIWGGQITDSYWYLYLYLGLLVMLPLLQRLCVGMKKRDMLYLMGVSFGVNALWPLLTHYLPLLKLNAYFDLPLFSLFIGLFFAGHYVHRYVKPTRGLLWGAALTAALCLAASLWLTWLEYGRTAGVHYWFMDERTAPSLPTLLCALSLMVLGKGLMARPLGERSAGALRELGGCTFAVYLMQDWLIAQTKNRVFLPLCNAMPSFAAVLIWEIGLFAVLLAVAWALRRVPGLKRLL